MATNFEQQVMFVKYMIGPKPTLVKPSADTHFCSAVCVLLACCSAQVTPSASAFSHEASPRTYQWVLLTRSAVLGAALDFNYAQM